MTPEEIVVHARAQRHADLESLDGLDDAQLDYLSRVQELVDPITEGVDCDADVDYG